MTQEERIKWYADKIQAELHAVADNIKNVQKNRKISYQDICNSFFIQKLAEQQIEIDDLKRWN